MKKILSIYSGLPKSIYILFVARIINSLGSFVFPFITLFLTKKIGLSPEEVGFYVMLSCVAGIPGNLIGGFLADKYGRKWVYITLQALSAVLLIPCAFLGHSMLIPWLLILSIVFSNAARPVNSAMVADIAWGEMRQRAQSLLYLGINIGFAVGPLVAGFLFNNYLEWIFLGDAITTIVSLILVAVFIKETYNTNNNQSTDDETNQNDNPLEAAVTDSTIVALLKRPILISFCLIAAILSFVYSQHTFTLPMYLDKIFVNKGTEIFGMIMTTNAIVVVCSTAVVTYITKRFKSIVNAAIAGGFYAIGFGMLYFTSNITLFFVSTMIWTVGEILVTTNNGVYIAFHTPSSHRGRFNAILPFISFGLGSTLGPLVMGSFIDSYGIRNVWIVCFVLALFASAMLFALCYIEDRVNNKNQISGLPL